ncbi:hypothetical protein D3C72_591470 [compost metagenome]
MSKLALARMSARIFRNAGETNAQSLVRVLKSQKAPAHIVRAAEAKAKTAA